MQPKKNPQIDPKRNSFLFFQLGLAAVTVLTYIAIELKTYDEVVKVETVNKFDQMMDDEVIPMTEQIQKAPPPPPPAPEVIKIVEDKVEVKETVIETSETNEKQEVKAAVIVEAEEDDTDYDKEVVFTVLEDQPVFPGCEGVAKDKRFDCFNEQMAKHVGKNIKYPEDAAENGIQGKVFVAFTIAKDGSVTNLRMKGPKGGESLEKEAARIMSKLPKFQPGKQRGRPVPVSFNFPVNFKLQ